MASGDGTYRPGGTPDGAGTALARPGRLLVAAAVLVVGLGALAVVETMSHPDRLGFAFSGGSQPLPPITSDRPRGVGAAEVAAEQTVTAPLGGRRRAIFELVDGPSTFDLGTADLGDDLYRVTAAVDGGVAPRVEVRGDRVWLRSAESGHPGPATVQVLLNTRVVWRLRLVGGVNDQVLDLDGARLAGVELFGGASRTELRLPRLVGSLTVRMTGGVNQLTVRVPGAPPVRVRAAAGAGSVAVYRDRRDGVAAGELVSSPNWDRSTDRLFVDLVAGANAVIVEESEA
ncbi:MAG: hypothetical protein WA890_04620 [Micromonospora sp.]